MQHCSDRCDLMVVVRSHRINKPNGCMRKLDIHPAVDQTLQQAIVQARSPIFEKEFLEYS